MAKRKSAKEPTRAQRKKASKRAGAPKSDGSPAQQDRTSASGTRWTFLTNHTHVLVLLDTDEPPVLREVATRVGITERAVQRIIQDLEEGGFIKRERVGRRNRYAVLREEHLRHPIESHRTIGDLLKLVVRRS